MNAGHAEPSPLPSTRRIKRNNKNEMCHNKSKHTQTHMQVVAQETIIKMISGRTSKIPEKYGYCQGI